LTFASVVEQVFVRTYLYENVCHPYVHSRENQVIFIGNVLHKHSFWKKEASGNSEVELKSAYEPSGPSGRRLSRFL